MDHAITIRDIVEWDVGGFFVAVVVLLCFWWMNRGMD